MGKYLAKSLNSIHLIWTDMKSANRYMIALLGPDEFKEFLIKLIMNYVIRIHEKKP